MDPQTAPPTIMAAPAPEKYRLLRAMLDAFGAIKTNAAGFFLVVILSYIAAVIASMGVLAGAAAASAGLLLAAFSLPTIIGLAVAGVVLATIWFALVAAFVMGTSSLAVYAGADGQKSAVGATLKAGFHRMKRLALVNILVAMVAIWPLLAAAGLGAVAVYSGSPAAALLAFVLPIAGVIWLYIALLRLALSPYVALFEPDVPVTQVLSRSTHLMLRGGQWFVLKGVGLLLVLVIILAMTTNSTFEELSRSDDPVITLIFLVASMAANATLVMLYRNRRLARDQAAPVVAGIR